MFKLMICAAALLLAAGLATAKEVLTVYTYESFVSEWGPGAKIKAAFEKDCDCEVKWVAVADGVAMLNRIKLEGTSTEADVVLGLDTNLTDEARQLGLFGQHDVDINQLTLPVKWEDKEFLPYDFGHFAVVYDSEKLKTPPTSIDDLVNGDPSQKIILQDPRSSTPGLGFLLWMKGTYRDEAVDAWRKLKPRILTTTPGWSEAYGLFTKGEAPMVFSYITSPAYHVLVENTERYKAAPFSGGHYVQIEVAGYVKSSPEASLAKNFLAFIPKSGFQDHIPTNNWMMPVGNLSSPLPDAFRNLVVPEQTLLFPPDVVNANRRAWIDEWLSAVQ
jgi:thiamine transport system substrate-binding protein